ncbi:MAG: acetylornithine deacetylase/succinyl-diaminopimelate desuccinylase [Verrucomicrobia bacterium]|jgi:acetylornithine deacetylase/succinyl-diaminopimelate desuccinylase-like protein|nr:MAG: acetylornithine deacetylase/succinyl-diaminopimelate desuccinylase [Verrucomicrobiota bacterium]
MTSFPSGVVDLLRDLIAIPSVNPDGDPGTDRTGELACAEYVADFLTNRCGAETVLEEVLPGRPNVIARFPCERDRPSNRLLLGPHLDTVGVGGMTIPPFGAEVRDGRVWGRGASDTKGSMAAMLWALHEHRDLVPKLDAQILFAGFVSEESGQDGSRDFARRHAEEVDFALVGEPTGMDAVHAHKASWWLEFSTTGRAAHGARPELGDNAILKLVPLIEALEAFARESLPGYDDPVLGRSTLSINRCLGGTRTNIVPDRALLEVDLRATPSLHGADIPALLRQWLDLRGLQEAKIRILGESPVLHTPTAHPMVQRLHHLGSRPITAPWFCDAGWLAQAGIPGVAIGPGSIDQAHTKDEWIRISDLEEGAAFFGKFLRSFAD